MIVILKAFTKMETYLWNILCEKRIFLFLSFFDLIFFRFIIIYFILYIYHYEKIIYH